MGYVDIQKYMTLFLSQLGVQSTVTTPNNHIIITDYTDGFPWLKWLCHFTGETSVRVKIIERYSLLSTVLTVALWLGNDDYNTVKACAGAVYEQLKQLKTIKHTLSGKEIKIISEAVAMVRKEDHPQGILLQSSYPIPEAPEHHSQLGDMKLSCPCPVWSVKDTENLETKFKTELSGEAPTKEKRREFAKSNLGNTGRRNISGTPLSEYFPGTSHLGFRSAETICLRIAKIASGLYP